MFTIAKRLTCQRYIYKLNSADLVINDWNITITPKTARIKDNLIALADSQVLRFIAEIRGIDPQGFEDASIDIQKKIRQIKKMDYYKGQKKDIKQLYDELDTLQIIEDYIVIEFDTAKNFYTACKGVMINGKKYIRFIGMPAGLKNKNVVFINEEIYDQLNEKVTNGHNSDIKIVANKYEAYRALACSSSLPIPFTEKILVVQDCLTNFKDSVIVLDDTQTAEPIMTEVDNYEIELNANDGFGLVTPEYNCLINEAIGESGINSGHCIRGSYLKGMVVPFDFKAFAKEIAHKNIVIDAWGIERNIEDVDIILTTSMLKLWDKYDSLEHYIANCKKNNFGFSITKACPKKLENSRELNYQFIQSYLLDDEDISKLCNPTVEKYQQILGLDYIQTILFLKGIGLNEENVKYTDSDFVKALMIEPDLMKDKFVYTKVFNMLKRKINQAKVGHLEVAGNFQVVIGDPFLLCQSIFGLEKTGLLTSGEVYSKYWKDKQIEQVVGFRAPMTPHNNIRRMQISFSDECAKWYKYLTTVIILNGWDTITHSLNGCDFDADTIFTTNNEVLLNNLRDTRAIVCIQKNAEKVVPTSEILAISNKQSFGQKIGVVTNRATTMFALINRFPEGTKEYEALDYRIKACQNYQQNAIDATKGIIAKDMPKSWYDATFLRKKIRELTENEAERDEDIIKKEIEEAEFNLKIVADKKPYFMGYVYPKLLKEYKDYKKNCNLKSLQIFGVELGQLDNLALTNPDALSEEQIVFYKKYLDLIPLDEADCVMNKICRLFEEKFDHFLTETKSKNNGFNHNCLKSYKTYDKKVKTQIYNAVQQYFKEMSDFKYLSTFNKMQREDISDGRNGIKSKFTRICEEICPNQEDLCNILVDLCYEKNLNRQLLWDVSGEQIIANLLDKNNYIINTPVADKYGDVVFNGERFSLKKVNAREVYYFED